ncbi:hypothetical protein [Pricia sp.]|uniref:hypothetical protein n=1 Tax=Pricia sp. TaxID=2268138 RepID=UPI0035943A87
MKNKILLFLLAIFILSCESDDSDSHSDSNLQELPLSKRLIGAWNLTDYYSDTYFEEWNEGRIEEIVSAETDYGIEFTDNPKRIILTGFLRYSFKEYEIVDGEKVITYEATNFMDAEHGEGYHTNEWRVENEILITEDPRDGDPYFSLSEMQLSGDNLKLTLDPSQFNPKNSGEITVEYKRK